MKVQNMTEYRALREALKIDERWYQGLPRIERRAFENAMLDTAQVGLWVGLASIRKMYNDAMTTLAGRIVRLFRRITRG